MIPPKLQVGDEIRVVSPATSLAVIPQVQRDTAQSRFEALGLHCTFSSNAEALDQFDSSTVDARVADLHEAFSDPKVKGIFTTLGGYNSNQLLRYLDYELIQSNPKVLCGYSDITALATAIYVKTGLVTYYGPHFSTFGMVHGIDYTHQYMARCLTEDGPFDVLPADHWSDDAWYENQEARTYNPSTGYHVIREGHAEGRLLGGHLGTFCLLAGSEYMPDLDGTILLLESDFETRAQHFDCELQSLIHQPGFNGVRGLVFGRFQRASDMDMETLTTIIHSKPDLTNIPVVANASFGHTTPQFTFPIGGRGILNADNTSTRLQIIDH